jgi:hypothetical protein
MRPLIMATVLTVVIVTVLVVIHMIRHGFIAFA